MSNSKVVIQPEGKVFMPGNLRASNEEKKYRKMIEIWMEERYTLRYTGAMVRIKSNFSANRETEKIFTFSI